MAASDICSSEITLWRFFKFKFCSNVKLKSLSCCLCKLLNQQTPDDSQDLCRGELRHSIAWTTVVVGKLAYTQHRRNILYVYRTYIVCVYYIPAPERRPALPWETQSTNRWSTVSSLLHQFERPQSDLIVEPASADTKGESSLRVYTC